MNSKNNQIFVLFIALLGVACSNNPTAAPIDYKRLEAVSITDEIVLSSSDFIIADSVRENIYGINFGNTNTFTEGKLLDASISYTTPGGCDEDVFIFNNNSLRWKQFGFQPNVSVCTTALTRWNYLLSTINIPFGNFFNSEGRVLIKSNRVYRVNGRIFEVSSDYFESSTPISKLGSITSKIDFVEDSFWVFTDRDNLFHKKFSDGRENYSIRSRSEQVSAFSVDGQTIWYIDHAGKVSGIDNVTGVVKCRFQSATSHPTGLTTDGNNLWISFNASLGSRLHSYDLSRSCENSFRVLLKDIKFSDIFVRGLDWDGSHLLVLDNKLNVIDNEGLLITEYTLKVFGAFQVVWDGEAVMLFHHGPVPEGSSESIVTRFLLN